MKCKEEKKTGSSSVSCGLVALGIILTETKILLRHFYTP